MKLRRLNEDGLEELVNFLDAHSADELPEYPEWLLTDDEFSEQIVPKVEINVREFETRYDFADYINDVFLGADLTGIETDKGIWAWLSLLLYEQLCPVNKNGDRNPGELARWIPAVGDFQKYYRHLLAGPFRIYRGQKGEPELAFALLSNPLNQPGDIAEQLASRQEFVTNPAIMEVATMLYIDSATNKPKRGAASKSGGSARRLAKILWQYDVTFDLYSLTSEKLMELLPSEFDKFRS